ncbi:12892_t:CDS:2, partial [Gigaspora margarita]
MQTLLNRQLHDYLLSIITELCTKKNIEINVIDDLVTNQNAKTRNQKQCHKCSKKEIENSKHKCLQYKSTSSISITQNLNPQDSVKIPDVLVPDPLLINPNSVDNICKVFDYIQNI